MAKTTTKKRELIIGGKVYKMPDKMDSMAYLDYLDVRDRVMDTEKQQALYTKSQFLEMVDVIAEVYGNQFTAEDILAKDGGLSPDQIIMEFTLIDASVGQRVNDNVERYKENFIDGK